MVPINSITLITTIIWILLVELGSESAQLLSTSDEVQWLFQNPVKANKFVDCIETHSFSKVLPREQLYLNSLQDFLSSFVPMYGSSMTKAQARDFQTRLEIFVVGVATEEQKKENYARTLSTVFGNLIDCIIKNTGQLNSRLAVIIQSLLNILVEQRSNIEEYGTTKETYGEGEHQTDSATAEDVASKCSDSTLIEKFASKFSKAILSSATLSEAYETSLSPCRAQAAYNTVVFNAVDGVHTCDPVEVAQTVSKAIAATFCALTKTLHIKTYGYAAARFMASAGVLTSKTLNKLTDAYVSYVKEAVKSIPNVPDRREASIQAASDAFVNFLTDLNLFTADSVPCLARIFAESLHCLTGIPASSEDSPLPENCSVGPSSACLLSIEKSSFKKFENIKSSIMPLAANINSWNDVDGKDSSYSSLREIRERYENFFRKIELGGLSKEKTNSFTHFLWKTLHKIEEQGYFLKSEDYIPESSEIILSKENLQSLNEVHVEKGLKTNPSFSEDILHHIVSSEKLSKLFNLNPSEAEAERLFYDFFNINALYLGIDNPVEVAQSIYRGIESATGTIKPSYVEMLIKSLERFLLTHSILKPQNSVALSRGYLKALLREVNSIEASDLPVSYIQALSTVTFSFIAQYLIFDTDNPMSFTSMFLSELPSQSSLSLHRVIFDLAPGVFSDVGLSSDEASFRIHYLSSSVASDILSDSRSVDIDSFINNLASIALEISNHNPAIKAAELVCETLLEGISALIDVIDSAQILSIGLSKESINSDIVKAFSKHFSNML